MQRSSLAALLLVAACAVVSSLAGCGSGNSGEPDKQYMASAAEMGKDAKALYAKTGGDYSKLSPEEKKRYLGYFSGIEKNATDFWAKMKTGNFGPSSAANPPQN